MLFKRSLILTTLSTLASTWAAPVDQGIRSGSMTFYDPSVGFGSCGTVEGKNSPIVAMVRYFLFFIKSHINHLANLPSPLLSSQNTNF